jgi:Abnormal spindle-like microcephaly-assoc'd, ASPM-SPD-2-Hydin
VAFTTGTQYADVTNCVTASPIAPNSSCTISVTFTPTSTGLKSDTVNITSNYAGSPQAVGVTGTGVTGPVPGVTLSPTSLNFGLQLLSPSTATQVITLTNSGNANLTVTAVAMTTGTSFTVSADTCISGSPIASNGTCTITIQFSPTVVGPASDNVNITDNATGSPQTAGVMGTGVSSGQVQPTVQNATVTAH